MLRQLRPAGSSTMGRQLCKNNGISITHAGSLQMVNLTLSAVSATQIRRMLCQIFGGSDSPIVEHPSDAVRVALIVHWYRY